MVLGPHCSQRLLVLGVLAMVVAGCASAPPPTTTTRVCGPGWTGPEWVCKGSGAFGGERGKALIGVGAASGIKNTALLRTTAENRARTDVARVLRVYVAGMIRDYAASTTAGDFSKTAEEQHVESINKSVTSATLSGVEIVDRYHESLDDTLYALARLDFVAVKTALEGLQDAKELDARVRDYVRQQAEKGFDRLEKELEKQQK